MKIKGITDEDFINFKLPSLYIAFNKCSFKCDKENGCSYCHNSNLANEPDINISKEKLIERYISNPITKSIVCGGLEPFDSEMDLLPFIDCLRRQYNNNSPIVIYTGYTEEELINGKWGHGTIQEQIKYYQMVIEYSNIIIKFGRFRPNEESHYDKILGVKLASNNQYAKGFNIDENYIK